MNILMTADTIGGVWTYAMELTRALAPRDVEVTLATMGRPLSAHQHAEAAALGNLRVEQSSFRLEWMQDPWEDVERAGDWLLELAARTNPDVVHLNSYVHAALPWERPLIAVAHSCVYTWWDAVNGRNAPSEWSAYHTAVQEGIAAADVLVTPTAALLAAMRNQYARFPATCVIPNARAAQRFDPNRQRALHAFSAGRLWDQAKNMETLRAAAASLGYSILVAGDTTAPDGSTVDPYPLQSLGMLSESEMADQLSRAAVYAAPALYEPFGLSVLEAALSGCALVLGDIPTFQEVWGDTALYVPPRDPAALADGIDRLMKDHRLREWLAQRSYRRALRYAPASMAHAYLGVYAHAASLHEQDKLACA
jgi:glycogen synthase